MKASRRLELLNERQKENAMREEYDAMMGSMYQQEYERLKISATIHCIGIFFLFCVIVGLIVALVKSI